MSNIEWTGKTWNPVIGCRRVSEGCRNCYAEQMAGRIVAMGGAAGERYAEVVKGSGPAGRWNGRAVLVPSKLDEPLRRRRPTTWFVNSMSDLFHEDLTNEEIAAVFGVMAATPRHTYQVLTKRPERMARWFGWLDDMATRVGRMFAADDRGRRRGHVLASEALRHGVPGVGATDADVWPLPHVWIGVSVEDQATADERIQYLLDTPAAVRFVSAEPLLGPVDLRNLPSGQLGTRILDALTAGSRSETPWHLSWVIVGGESGPGARPCDVAWIRGIVEQCSGAGVACFVKQLGMQPVDAFWQLGGGWPMGTRGYADGRVKLRHRKGSDMDEWPDDLRVRQMPDEVMA